MRQTCRFRWPSNGPQRGWLNFAGVSHLFFLACRRFFVRGILQKKGPQSCPLAILNGLLDILLTLGSTTSPFLTNSKNFGEIQRYLQDLIPMESRRLRRLMVVDQAHRMKPAVYEDDEGNEYEDFGPFVHHEVDEAKIEKLGIRRRLEAVRLLPNYVLH